MPITVSVGLCADSAFNLGSVCVVSTCSVSMDQVKNISMSHL